MAYTTYISEALVCGSKPSNTSDKAFLLFTREAGMVWATARSVREERSKQRFALQDFSYIRTTLVRGKGGWRIAGVEPYVNMYFDAGSREFRKVLRNTVLLLQRVLQGDTPHPELFDDVLVSLRRSEERTVTSLETVLALRILKALGYVAPHNAYKSILECSYAYEGASTLTSEEEKACATAVEHALISSQL